MLRKRHAVVLASVVLIGAIVLVAARSAKHAASDLAASRLQVPSAQSCKFAPLPPLHLAGGLVSASAGRTRDGVLISLVRAAIPSAFDPATTARRETLVTVTADAIDVTDPEPFSFASLAPIAPRFGGGFVPAAGAPTAAFVWATQTNALHFVYYEGEQGALVIQSRVGGNASSGGLTIVSIPRELDGHPFTATSVTSVAVASRFSDDRAFVIGGVERTPDPHGVLRIYGSVDETWKPLYVSDDAAGLVAVDAVDDADTGARVTETEHIAYTFVESGKLYAGVLEAHTSRGETFGWSGGAPQEKRRANPAPFVVGASVAGAVVALDAAGAHFVWGERGTLHHATVSIISGALRDPETKVDAPSDGSRPALQIVGAMTHLAWRDATHIWYGEGGSVESAAHHSGALADANGAHGPWIASVPKGTLITWISSTNELRRALVTCD